MKRILLVVVVVFSTAVSAQQTAVASRTRPAVEFLASDRLEGRDTGSPGERMAGDYIAMQLARAGAKPLAAHRDMFMPFEFTAGTRDGGSTLTIRGGGGQQRFRGSEQVQALSFSDDATINGPVVFAGYGLVVPESQGFGYDSYAGLDVKDKIVLVLHYFPEDTDAKTKAALARYSDLRYKALAARQHGAKGLLIVIGPRSPNAGQTLGDRRRALRSSRPRHARDLARRERGGGADPSRRGRQRIGHLRRTGHCGEARHNAAAPQRDVHAVVRRRDRPRRLERVRHESTGAAESGRRVCELRHGWPHAEQQAGGRWRGIEPGVGAHPRAREYRRRIRSRDE